MMAETTSGRSPEIAAKRQKTGVACDPCRARKVRCNGERPVCDVCYRRRHKGAICRYGGDEGIESGGFRPGLTPEASRRQPSNEDGQGSVTATGLPSQLDQRTPNEARDRDAIVRNVTESIKSSGAVIRKYSYTQGFFGSSSAGSFMRQITSAIDKKVGALSRQVSPPLASPAKIPLFLESPSVNIHDDISSSISYALPPRRTADHLMGIYWRHVHPLYPFLERRRFEESYHSIWSGTSANVDERILLSTLNAVFALACQLASSIKPQNREEAAETYFRRAKELLRIDLWSVGSTELIQCLLLMGQYLQSTNTPQECWMVVGHAIRIAQGLGFHNKESNLDLHSIRDREVARIIWHGCIMMDRTISLNFGRPTMISSSLAAQVPFPADIDLDHDIPVYTPESNSPHEERPKMIEFFIQSLRLYEIIHEIIQIFYIVDDRQQPLNAGQSRCPADNINFARIIDLDRALTAWSRKLPSHLCFPVRDWAIKANFRRQAIICKARLFHARITLFRPVLAQYCEMETSWSSARSPEEDSFSYAIAQQCSIYCLKAAHEIINLIYTNLDRGDGLFEQLPEWWFCLSYAYTAATVLLAARLQPLLADSVKDYSLDISWAHALEILRLLEPFGQSAQRCVAALDILSAKISQHSSGTGTGPGPGHINHADLNPNGEVLVDSDNRPSMASSNYLFDDGFDGFDLSGIDFNLQDMSWLNSLPGNF